MSARIALGALVGTFVLAAPAAASAPPVGKLPAGPKQTITAPRGQLVAFALPHAASGRAWRVARPVDPNVLREVSEADLDTTLVVVYRAYARGQVTVAYALTRGERPHAYASRTFTVVVE